MLQEPHTRRNAPRTRHVTPVQSSHGWGTTILSKVVTHFASPTLVFCTSKANCPFSNATPNSRASIAWQDSATNTLSSPSSVVTGAIAYVSKQTSCLRVEHYQNSIVCANKTNPERSFDHGHGTLKICKNNPQPWCSQMCFFLIDSPFEFLRKCRKHNGLNWQGTSLPSLLGCLNHYAIAYRMIPQLISTCQLMCLTHELAITLRPTVLTLTDLMQFWSTSHERLPYSVHIASAYLSL